MRTPSPKIRAEFPQGDIPRTMLVARDGTITTIEGAADMAEIGRLRKTQLGEPTSR